MTPPSRRDILKAATLAASVAGTGSLLTGCSKGENVKSGPASIKASEVPVGGAKIITDSNFVVAQPTAGVFVAFTRLCPHAGCNVDQVQDATITCSCHGSQFSAKDGSVTKGPATAGLSKATAKLSGDTVNVSA